MANPQPDIFVKWSTELATAIARTNLSAYESRVLWCVAIKTYGWDKKTDRISFSQFEEITQMKRWHIARTLTLLLERNIILKKVGGPDGQIIEYGIQKDYEKWKNSHLIHNKLLPNGVIETITYRGNDLLPNEVTVDNNKLLPNGVELLPSGVELLPSGVTVLDPLPPIPPITPVKANTKAYTKAIIEKSAKETFYLPEWVNLELWEAFMDVRKKKKAIQSSYALKLIINELTRLRAAGNDPDKVLERSIRNTWKDVYSLGKNINFKEPQVSSQPISKLTEGVIVE